VEWADSESNREPND